MPIGEWILAKDARADGFSGDVALGIVRPHQGEHMWWIAFDPGDSSVRVDVELNPETIVPVSNTLSWFVEDLAMVGEAWANWTRRAR